MPVSQFSQNSPRSLVSIVPSPVMSQPGSLQYRALSALSYLAAIKAKSAKSTSPSPSKSPKTNCHDSRG
jgi:hypothetical protein